MINTNIKLETENMSMYEFARWASLLEAVELIASKCSFIPLKYKYEVTKD